MLDNLGTTFRPLSGRDWPRVKDDSWPLLQVTAAATIAWAIAKTFGDHPDPFFAPIAAVIAMNAERGDPTWNRAGGHLGPAGEELAATSPQILAPHSGFDIIHFGRFHWGP
jgi:hypothetical protein